MFNIHFRREIRNTKLARTIGVILCLALSALFIVLYFVTSNNSTDWVETEAIVKGFTDDVDVTRTVITYFIGGLEYTTTLGEYDSTWKVGKTIKIKYNPNDYNDVVSNGFVGKYFLLIIGIVFILIAIAIILISIYRDNLTKKAVNKELETANKQASLIDLDFDKEQQLCLYGVGVGSLNYFLKTSDGQTLITATVEGNEYTFVNHITSITTKHKISSTVKSRDPLGFSEDFKLDGKYMITDVLANKNIKIGRPNGAFSIDYSVLQNDEEIAKIKFTAIDAAMHNNKMSVESPIFTINTKLDNLDDKFLAIFFIAHKYCR